MTAKTRARDIHLARTAQVAGEAFGHQALHDADPAHGWARPALALLLATFLITAAYLAF